MGTYAIYAIGVYCVSAVFLFGGLGIADFKLEEFWCIIFSPIVVEYIYNMVGLVCLRCRGNRHVAAEFLFHVFAFWDYSMVTAKKEI